MGPGMRLRREVVGHMNSVCTLSVTSFSLPADLKSSSRIRGAAAGVAREAGLSSSRIYDLQVAVSEAVASAIEYCCLPGDEVRVEVAWLTDRLEVRIHSPRPYSAALGPRLLSHQGGFGLPLMASLADQVIVRRRVGGGATLAVVFSLAPCGLPTG